MFEDLFKTFSKHQRVLDECHERELEFLRGGGATRGSNLKTHFDASAGPAHGREINPARPTQKEQAK